MPSRNTILRSPKVQDDFDSANPIDFNLHDDEGEQQIYILNDQSPGRTHHLVLFNNSGQGIQLKKPEGSRLPSATNHHFELRFRPGTFDPSHLTWLSVGSGGWRISYEVENETTNKNGIHHSSVSLYLLFVGEETWTLEDGSAHVVILHLMKAAVSGGSRGSRIELRYHLDGVLVSPDQTSGKLKIRQERLQIINNRGKKELPMLAAFEGSSTVLNDGRTPNSLSLQISNFLQNSTIKLNARDSESPTKFILSFDTSEEQAAWALCDGDNAAAIDVEMHFEDQHGTNWHIRPELQGNHPQWVITLIDDIEVQVGEYFHLHLDGLKTDMPSGFTKLYLLYENIPGFWDGRFEIPIEKSPLKFDDQKKTDHETPEAHEHDGSFIQRTKVGIGNTQPVDTLDVNGGVQSETLRVRNWKSLKDGEVKSVEFPLEVDGKIRAEGINLSGKVVTESSSTNDLQVNSSLTLGTVKVTEEEGTSKNLKVDGRLKDSTGYVIPPGGIIMWSGVKENIPEGWKLCDGSNRTPDLRGKFIVGYDPDPEAKDYNQAGTLSEGKSAKGKTGGNAFFKLETKHLPSHSHSITIQSAGKHSHRLGSRGFETNGAPGADGSLDDKHIRTHESGAHTHPATIGDTGGNIPHDNRPPYYVLAFIMKK